MEDGSVRSEANVDTEERLTPVAGVGLRTRIVDAAGDGQYAQNFHKRYGRLYVAADMVAAMVELSDGWNEDQRSATAAFDIKRERWELHGGFIETVSVDDVSRWLESNSDVIVEVAAPGSDRGSSFDAVAQSLLRIPTTAWVIPLLDGPDDEVSDKAFYDAILDAGPGASALADYLGVLPEWAGQGVAAEARYAVMLELIRRNGTRDPDAQISYIVGLTFAVQGVDVLGGPDGQNVERSIRLSDFGEREITNRASVRINGVSRRSPAHLIGKRKSCPGVPVTIGTARYVLRVHWYYFVRCLDEVSL